MGSLTVILLSKVNRVQRGKINLPNATPKIARAPRLSNRLGSIAETEVSIAQDIGDNWFPK
jgi:hypothetical protein